MRRYIILLPLLFILLLVVACNQDEPTGIRPIRATSTPGTLLFSADASPVTFSELAASPRQFLNRNIRVTGAYTPQEAPTCLPYRGPRVSWALVDSELQMNAAGYERIVALLPPDVPMTVEGIWRLYEGPLGCGKKPAISSVWYLDVLKIVQPNPIVGADGVVAVLDSAEDADTTRPPEPGVATPTTSVSPTATGTATPTATATATPTPSPTPTATPTVSATVTITGTPTITPTGTVTATPTATTTATVTITPSGTPATATPSPTPDGTPVLPPPVGTSTPDPGGDATPTAYPGQPTSTPYP